MKFKRAYSGCTYEEGVVKITGTMGFLGYTSMIRNGDFVPWAFHPPFEKVKPRKSWECPFRSDSESKECFCEKLVESYSAVSNPNLIHEAIDVSCENEDVEKKVHKQLQVELRGLFETRKEPDFNCFEMKNEHPLRHLFTMSTPDVQSADETRFYVHSSCEYHQLEHLPQTWYFDLSYTVVNDVVYVRLHHKFAHKDCVFKCKLSSKKQKIKIVLL